MKTLNERVKKAGPEWTRQWIPKGERSVVDFMVMEKLKPKGNGNTCMRSGLRKY